MLSTKLMFSQNLL